MELRGRVLHVPSKLFCSLSGSCEMMRCVRLRPVARSKRSTLNLAVMGQAEKALREEWERRASKGRKGRWPLRKRGS